MSEVIMNGVFDALKRERDIKQAKLILAQSKEREDFSWKLYKCGLIKYDNTFVI